MPRSSAPAVWQFRLPPLPEATRVGILGLGELGRDAARVLRGHGFTVRGWSRSTKEMAGVACFAGAPELAAFLAETDILVCMLPLTAETRGILDAGLMAQLPAGCPAHQRRARRASGRGRPARRARNAASSPMRPSTWWARSRCRRSIRSGAIRAST